MHIQNNNIDRDASFQQLIDYYVINTDFCMMNDNLKENILIMWQRERGRGWRERGKKIRYTSVLKLNGRRVVSLVGI